MCVAFTLALEAGFSVDDATLTWHLQFSASLGNVCKACAYPVVRADISVVTRDTRFDVAVVSH